MRRVLGGMAQVSDGRKSPLLGVTQGGAVIGVPSTELSLGWMLASRASLRFTRRGGNTARVPKKQEQAFAGQEDLHRSNEGSLVFCPNNGVHFSQFRRG